MRQPGAGGGEVDRHVVEVLLDAAALGQPLARQVDRGAAREREAIALVGGHARRGDDRHVEHRVGGEPADEIPLPARRLEEHGPEARHPHVVAVRVLQVEDRVRGLVEGALPARILLELAGHLRSDRDHVARVEEGEPRRGAGQVHRRVAVAGNHAASLLRDLRLEPVDRRRRDRGLQEHALQRGPAGEQRQVLEHAHAAEAVVQRRVLVGDARVGDRAVHGAEDPGEQPVRRLPLQTLVVPVDPGGDEADRGHHPGDDGRGEREGAEGRRRREREEPRDEVDGEEQAQEVDAGDEADLGQADRGPVEEAQRGCHGAEEEVAPGSVGGPPVDRHPEDVEARECGHRVEDARHQVLPRGEVPLPVDRRRVAELGDERHEPEPHEQHGARVDERQVADVAREVPAVEQEEEARRGGVQEGHRVAEAGDRQDDRT